MKIKRLLAFTLAETLIVMGVIGIVSALTLPNLNSSTGEKEKVAKVKKIYRDLNDALGRAEAVYGPFDEWKSLDNTYAAQTTRFGERMTEFMKVSKNCGTTANKGCFSNSKLTYLNGNDSDYFDTNLDSSSYYKFIVADGTSVGLSTTRMVVDIDGPKGRNQIGYDVFTFGSDIINNPFYHGNSSGLFPLGALTTGGGFSAAYWVINNDNMNYLKNY